jgi:hypothetical protein
MGDRPIPVRRGVYALALVTIATLVYIWSYTEPWTVTEKMWMWALVFLPTNGLFAWLLFLTWRRRNWARWAAVLWCVLGAIAVIGSLIYSNPSTVDVAVQSAMIAIEVWGCQQLLSGSAASWFRTAVAV